MARGGEEEVGVLFVEGEELWGEGGKAEVVVCFGEPCDLPAGFSGDPDWIPSGRADAFLGLCDRVEGFVGDAVPAFVFAGVDIPAGFEELPEILDCFAMCRVGCAHESGIRGVGFGGEFLAY